MFCRLAATALAGALVLVPPVRAGLDVAHDGTSPDSNRRRPSRENPLAAPASRGGLTANLTSSSGSSVGERRDGDEGVEGDTPASAVGAFGFGPRTGFFPTEERRELVLSFDDGPDLKFTPLVLDELDKRGLKAIFFVTGHRVVGDRPEDLARRELLRRIAAHGHLVGNHTMTHRNLCQPGSDAAGEIDETGELIAQATGIRPLLFRAPYGARCRQLEAALIARQLVSVGWNLDPQDWKNPTSEGILAYLQSRLSRLEGRGILLLHDTHPASVFALGPLLDWIARENRIAARDGRAPIVMRDYSVFLPARAVPRAEIVTVARAVLDGVWAGLAPPEGLRARLARR